MDIFREDLQCPTKLTEKKPHWTLNFTLSFLWKQPSQLPDPTHTDVSSSSKPHTKSHKVLPGCFQKCEWQLQHHWYSWVKGKTRKALLGEHAIPTLPSKRFDPSQFLTQYQPSPVLSLYGWYTDSTRFFGVVLAHMLWKNYTQN